MDNLRRTNLIDEQNVLKNCPIDNLCRTNCFLDPTEWRQDVDAVVVDVLRASLEECVLAQLALPFRTAGHPYTAAGVERALHLGTCALVGQLGEDLAYRYVGDLRVRLGRQQLQRIGEGWTANALGELEPPAGWVQAVPVPTPTAVAVAVAAPAPAAAGELLRGVPSLDELRVLASAFAPAKSPLDRLLGKPTTFAVDLLRNRSFIRHAELFYTGLWRLCDAELERTGLEAELGDSKVVRSLLTALLVYRFPDDTMPRGPDAALVAAARDFVRDQDTFLLWLANGVAFGKGELCQQLFALSTYARVYLGAFGVWAAEDFAVAVPTLRMVVLRLLRGKYSCPLTAEESPHVHRQFDEQLLRTAALLGVADSAEGAGAFVEEQRARFQAMRDGTPVVPEEEVQSVALGLALCSLA